MILAALAVIATVCVLNIVHTPQQLEPTRAMRKLCKALCRFVCMRNLYEQENSSLFHQSIKTIKVAPMVTTSELKGCCIHHTHDVDNDNEVLSSNEETDYSEEYTFYALVIDRTLFWLFLALNFILIVVLLVIYPSFSTIHVE